MDRENIIFNNVNDAVEAIESAENLQFDRYSLDKQKDKDGEVYWIVRIYS